MAEHPFIEEENPQLDLAIADGLQATFTQKQLEEWAAACTPARTVGDAQVLFDKLTKRIAAKAAHDTAQERDGS